MRFELQRRGVEESTAETVVTQVFEDPGEELRRAREIAARKSHGGAVEPDRLARQLDRKGFSKSVILRVLDDLESS
jgi:SOS response regulatory protein OraA/RecX